MHVVQALGPGGRRYQKELRQIINVGPDIVGQRLTTQHINYKKGLAAMYQYWAESSRNRVQIRHVSNMILSEHVFKQCLKRNPEGPCSSV